MTSTPDSQRLLTLDAMRGLAALIVVVFHANTFVDVVPNAYLAVDFFFLLSGVVIGRAYEPRLREGLPVLEFMKERVIRVYPLFILGLALGFGDALYQFIIQSEARPSVKFLTIGTFFNALLLPSPVSSHSTFPFNIPAWSLSLELLANFLFAAFIVKLPSRSLAWLLAVLGGCTVWLGLQPAELNVGDAWQHLLPGIVRTMFSFSAGILMSRHLRRGPASPSATSLLPAVALCGVLVAAPPSLGGIYDFILVGIAFPAIVWMGARANPPRALQGVAHLLGDTSYAIYAIHYPLIFMVAALATRLDVPVDVWLTAFVIAIVGVCHVAVKAYDTPVRRWMRRRWLTQRPSASPAGEVGDNMKASALPTR